MGLLSDKKIREKIASKVLVSDLAGGATSSQIKGSSIDLTIGSIFVPGTADGEPGSPSNPRQEFPLTHGQTVVVRTAENLKLDQSHAGLAFPAATESLKGLLMTNPGHVDPGYSGTLHVTLINMGRKDYMLRRGERVLRCLFFKLETPAERPYPTRSDPITADLLSQLSHDFMSIDKRVQESAKKEVEKAEFRVKILQTVVPVLGTLLVTAGGFAATLYTFDHGLEERLTKLEISLPTGKDLDHRVTSLEAIVPLQQKVDVLNDQTIRGIEDRVKNLEQHAQPIQDRK